MCRGFQPIDQTQRLFNLKSFHVTLSLSKPTKSLPDSLTLHYLPRITGGPLEVNGSVVKPDVPVFLTLYRVVSECKFGDGKKVVYGSRERVKVSEGVRFEVYVKEEKVVRGGFRKDGGGEWRVECRCGLEGGGGGGGVKEVEVVVGVEEGVMREVVEMVVRRRKKRCFDGLEEIVEQESEEDEEMEVRCCCCECSGGDGVEDGGDVVEDGGDVVEVEGVGWAVDVGIWVVCLGVGYLVSKASSKSLRRRRRLL
ncbi:hypothetical protein QVD17_13585 [Tagetes erecta]|uniref:Uncharacterized protein n=1 Tax=Tagetes erecta TaxID=13708 RepID=A0AAD8P3D0_TARER|nr:hypothetical protein QVD17_13585 [Tagetes erecta]